MSKSPKYKEAQDHLAAAEKYLKTSLFKWKPDYDSAISEYTKAATAFRNAKALDQAALAYMKAADNQIANGSHFHAAKAMESAAMQYKEMKEFETAVSIIHRACTLYLEHGVPDTAGIALERAAKMVERELPDKAIELYLRVCDVGEQEDNPRKSAEAVGKAGRLYIRQKKLPEAAKALSQEIEFYNQVDNNGLVNKLVMGLVLVHLHLGDSVAASKVYHSALSYPGFAESDEAGPIATVIEAFENCDQENADRALNDPLFRYMENDFTKLARDLRVPGGGKKKATQQPEVAATSASAPPGEWEEDAPAASAMADEDDEELDLK